MITTTGVPVTCDPEALAYVEELKLKGLLDRLVEIAAQTYDDLRRIQVSFMPAYEEVARVYIEPVRPVEHEKDQATGMRFLNWVTDNVSPNDWQYFGFAEQYESADGR